MFFSLSKWKQSEKSCISNGYDSISLSGARRGESVRCSADRISGWLGRNETAINNNEISFPPIQKIGFGHSVSIVYVTIGLDQRITTTEYNSVGAWIIELSLTWLFIEFVVGERCSKRKRAAPNLSVPSFEAAAMRTADRVNDVGLSLSHPLGSERKMTAVYICQFGFALWRSYIIYISIAVLGDAVGQ